jgi:hypothetical protein
MAELPQVESLTVRAIWAAVEATQDRSERTYLGASVLGDPCERKLWLAFRWAYEPEWFDGRKLSIFETGHRWEARLVELLRQAGLTVHDIDPETGEQFLVRFAGGHAGGHLDGEVEGVPEAPKKRHVFEAKSHNDKSFKELQRLRVQQAKPQHYDQMQVYMHLRCVERGLYVAVNKNDDDIYCERVAYDPAQAMRLVAKAERIVTSAMPPPCSCPPYFLKAGYGCAKLLGAWPRRNCRSCLHSTPRLDGDARWTCERWQRDLTPQDQRDGCPRHLFIPQLVPGDQIDCDPMAETVTYRLGSGRTWTDGEPEQPRDVSELRRANEFGVRADEITFEGAAA